MKSFALLLNLPLLAVLSLPHTHAATGTAITGDVTVDTRNTNLPPFASPSATVTNAATREVTLSANAGDLDGTVVSYAWTWDGGSANTASPVITLPYGTTVFSLMVTDNDGATATAGTSVELIPLATVDTSGDGLNDLLKYTLRDLGFDWTASQPELAATLAAAGLVSRVDLPAEGYYDLEGMRVLQAPAPVLARDAATGKVVLTLGVRQSSDLNSFTLLPATAPQVTITPAGEIQFEFDAPADSGFYRIEAK